MAGKPIAYVAVLHAGAPADAERDLAALRGLGGPVVDAIEAKSYLTTQHLNDVASAWGRRFSMRSAFLHSLPDEVVSDWGGARCPCARRRQRQLLRLVLQRCDGRRA